MQLTDDFQLPFDEADSAAPVRISENSFSLGEMMNEKSSSRLDAEEVPPSPPQSTGPTLTGAASGAMHMQGGVSMMRLLVSKIKNLWGKQQDDDNHNLATHANTSHAPTGAEHSVGQIGQVGNASVAQQSSSNLAAAYIPYKSPMYVTSRLVGEERARRSLNPT